MSSKDIRLRLAIRRHAVPEVKLVWPCVASEDLTVAKLLAQVNEVIPLESGEWGLEDYVVELADANGGSFECLHFQPVGKLFKGDDQVVIRSLLTEDLKRRRLSGRHQISTDGKHLIDGLAFGRPWLRVPRDRPALELPPRKKARITYDEEHDEDEESDDEEYRPQLLLEGPEVVETDEPSSVSLRVMFDDTDKDIDFEEDVDDEGNVSLDDTEGSLSSEQGDTDAEMEELDEDVNEELRLLLEDNAVVEDVPESKPGHQVHSILQDGLSALDKITALRSAFPLISVITIQNELVSHNMDLGQTFTSLERSNDAAISFDQMLDGAVCGFPSLSQSFLLDQDDTTFKGFESQESAGSGFRGISAAKPLIQEVESIDNSEAEDVDEDAVEANKESTTEVIPDSDEASSSESSSDDDSDESSSDDSDESSDDADDSDSDEEDDNPALSSGAGPSLPAIESDNQPSSDSDSDSDSSSDSGNGDGAEVDEAKDSDDSDDSSISSDSSSESEPEEESAKPKAQPQPLNSVDATAPAAPGFGLTRTQKRNARRREAKRIKQLEVMESQPPMISEAETEDPELLARKRALLSAVSESVSESPEREATNEPVLEVAQPKETPVAEKVPETTPSTGADSGRRLKVDMGAGRRLLFGALGLKNPKSKADEDKLRKSLMKDVRPLKNPRTESDSQADAANGDVAEEPEDPDAWREKISYRAVECCHDGIVLSEPPFPFVQRWDPQQQYKSMKKRKRSSQNFYDESYYDESYYDENSQWNEEQDDKKSKKRKSKGRHDETHDSPFDKSQDGADIVLNYDDAPAKRPGSSQFTDMDDLPSLPSDLKTLTTLQIENVNPGMVVTWKQLLMSKATKWQPQISSVTGLVLAVKEDNMLDLLLAKRDREPDEREYDAYTGKRVYEKFEAPADDEDEVDDGRREMAWIDMFDPRLVQHEPSPSLLATPAKKAGLEDSDVNKVSKSQDREEHVAEELDTQEVKARVEAELKGMAEDETSIRISPVNDPSTNESAENEDNRINSPSRQLHETSLAVIIEAEATKDEPNEAMDVEVEDSQDDEQSEEVIPNSIPSRSIPSLDIPSQPFKDSGKDSRLTPLRDYPMLAVPSSVSSIRSGRQPPSNYGLGESLDNGEDSVIPDTTPRAHETTPTPKSPEASGSSRSSSPFPSIEEIFHTCHTSRQTQSPGKSTQQSVLRTLKGRGKSDPEYEEAMRKFDEGDEESDQSLGKNKSIRSLFPYATQPEPSTELPDLPPSKTETPTKTTKFKKEKSSPFIVPEGSQVITLSSSPASERFEEDYAQDSIDETYQDSPLPKGSGWVKKKDKRNVPRRETRSRGKSLPAARVKSRAGLTRQLVPIPTASAVSQIKGRKKNSLRF